MSTHKRAALIYLVWPILLIALLFVVRHFWGSTTQEVGEALYQKHCQSCHGPEGRGFRSLVPPLAHADYLSVHYEELPCIIRHGMDDSIMVNHTLYTNPMAGTSMLSTSQIQSLVNYVQYRWLPDRPSLSVKEVRLLLEKCENINPK